MRWTKRHWACWLKELWKALKGIWDSWLKLLSSWIIVKVGTWSFVCRVWKTLGWAQNFAWGMKIAYDAITRFQSWKCQFKSWQFTQSWSSWHDWEGTLKTLRQALRRSCLVLRHEDREGEIPSWSQASRRENLRIIKRQHKNIRQLGKREERYGGKNGQSNQIAWNLQIRPNYFKRDSRLTQEEN